MNERARHDFTGHYDCLGSGPPILCFPGFGCANWIFKALATRLSDHATWVLPDPRGMGCSPMTAEPYSISDLAGDGLALMDQLGYERFAVMGISMGGCVAQSLVIAAPERVEALLLLCTTSPGPAFEPLPAVDEEILRAWYAGDPAEVVRANTDATVHPTLKQRAPERYREIRAAKLRYRASLEQLLLQQRAVKTFFELRLPLKTIACPTLIHEWRR